MSLQSNLGENTSIEIHNQNRTVIAIPPLTGIRIPGRFKRLALVAERKVVAAKVSRNREIK